MAEGSKKYILKSRTHDGFVDGKRKVFEEGDTVELTPGQYEAFKDKFEEAKAAPKAPETSKTTPVQPPKVQAPATK